MALQARSSFVIDRKDAAAVEWEGGNMGHNSFYKTFTGDLSGSSVVKAIMLVTENGGPAVYVGIERIDCTLMNRKGTFLLTHTATMRTGSQTGQWIIVPGSGTGELVDIHGRGEILPKHEFVLDYDFNPE